MNNPFENLNKRLSNIENILLDIQHEPQQLSEQANRWLDLSGLSDYLPSNPAHATIYSWLAKGSIPAHKQGKRWYFLVSEIDDWIKQGKQKTIKELEAETDEYLSNKKKGLQL